MYYVYSLKNAIRLGRMMKQGCPIGWLRPRGSRRCYREPDRTQNAFSCTRLSVDSCLCLLTYPKLAIHSQAPGLTGLPISRRLEGQRASSNPHSFRSHITKAPTMASSDRETKSPQGYPPFAYSLFDRPHSAAGSIAYKLFGAAKKDRTPLVLCTGCRRSDW